MHHPYSSRVDQKAQKNWVELDPGDLWLESGELPERSRGVLLYF
jgi:hypothetical protein